MRIIKYLLQYRFSHMGDMIRNSKKAPLVTENDLLGKNVLITGATAGIGLETAHLFAAKGANLILVNRNGRKSEKLEKELKEKYNCQVSTIISDFNSLHDIEKCCEQIMAFDQPLDVIIHNAGVFNTKKQYSKDNIEMVFQVNHMAAFYLNYKLKDRLLKENRCRIIYVNSEGHRFALSGVHLNDLDWKWHFYTGLRSYGAAKTAQLLTMKKFQDLFAHSSVTINAMHPGNVKSQMGNNNGKLYLWMKKKLILSSALDPDISAQSLLYLSAAEELKYTSGKFFHFTSEERPAPHALDEKMVEPVWRKSLQLCGLRDLEQEFQKQKKYESAIEKG